MPLIRKCNLCVEVNGRIGKTSMVTLYIFENRFLLFPSGAATAYVPPRQGDPDPGDRRGEERVGRGAAHTLLQQVHAAHEDEAG